MHLVVSEDFTHIKNKSLSNKVLEFISTDTKEEYEKNKNILGKDWYYYDKQIEYRYNSWGYRSKEFKDLSDDYILTFGCSCTEGVGLHVDDMWSTKIGKVLNKDVFNMGLGSTSVDFQFYNTLLLQNFFIKNAHLPKLVIYQWPSDYRTIAFYKNEIDNSNYELSLKVYSPHYDSSRDKDFFNWYKIGFVENCGELIKQSTIFPLTCDNIWNNMGIPVIHWTYEDDSLLDLKRKNINGINFRRLIDITKERARDCSHNGRHAQDMAVNIIIDTIKTNNITI